MNVKSFLSTGSVITVNDHPLTGDKLGLRSFSISGDIRVVYKETKDAYVFLDIGSHNQVY